MGLGAFIVLLVGTAVLGVVAQVLGKAHYSFEWLVAGIGAIVGGYVASEWLGPASTWGPEWDGLFFLPALIGALILGGLVDWIARSTSAAPAQSTEHAGH